jgi:predicted DNA-binding transcriptional regulator YafY
MADSNYSTVEFFRQTEILALCLNGPGFSKADLAEMFNVSGITIARDLQSLRKKGIQIFSRKKAVKIIAEPPDDVLITLASDYIPLKLKRDILSRQLEAFARNSNNSYFPLLTLLTKAVNEGLVVKMSYTKLYNDETKNYCIKPLKLCTIGFNWIIEAFDLEALKEKSFYINRIKRIILTNEHLDVIPDLNSSREKEGIVLRFNPEVESQISGKIFFNDYKLTKDENGYIILTTNEVISHRLAAWCISWHDMLEVLQPSELKVHIKNMIDSFSSINFRD